MMGDIAYVSNQTQASSRRGRNVSDFVPTWEVTLRQRYSTVRRLNRARVYLADDLAPLRCRQHDEKLFKARLTGASLF